MTSIKNDTLKYGQPSEMYNVNPYTSLIICFKKNPYVLKLMLHWWNEYNGFDEG